MSDNSDYSVEESNLSRAGDAKNAASLATYASIITTVVFSIVLIVNWCYWGGVFGTVSTDPAVRNQELGFLIAFTVLMVVFIICCVLIYMSSSRAYYAYGKLKAAQ